MMTPGSLARATPGFRCGYNDALNGRDMRVQENGSFGTYDYVEGYHAHLTEIRLEREDALRREYGDTRIPRLALTPRR